MWTVEALENYNPSGSLLSPRGAAATASGMGATSNINAGVLSFNALAAGANANANVSSYADSGATITAGGNVAILANADNNATASTKIISLGVVGFGAANAASLANGGTAAQLNGIAGLSAGGNLTIQALGTDESTSTSQADAGGVVGVNGAGSSADDGPNVMAAVSSSQLINVAGTTNITGLALGNSTATATGAGGGAIHVGDLGRRGVLESDDRSDCGHEHRLEVRRRHQHPQAFDNFNASGNMDTTRSTNAMAASTGGGLADVESAGITDNINSNTNADIQAGSSVSAGHDITIEALTMNQALGHVDGTAVGLGSGWIRGRHGRHDQSDVGRHQ